MFADGLNIVSDFAAFDLRAAASLQARQPRSRRCDFCHQPLERQPPVLLKSGHRIHLDCYLLLRKRETSDK
ncbi:MAG TPA: hypothetical protein VGS05_09465 [Candidatus Sulfotelmatobacter sp.]|nr:hypothetical protein [Candidatus Sulfotelmatobacter sp.]